MDISGQQTNVNNIFTELKHALQIDKLLYMLVFLSSIITFFIVSYFESEITYSYQFSNYLSMVAGCLYATFLAWSIYYYFKLLINRERKPTKKFFIAIKALFIPLDKPLIFMIRILILNVCFSNYTYIKQIIPDINPFQYDQLFSTLDQKIHGGAFPWEWTHSIFSSSIFTYFFTFSYHIWFVLIWGSFLYFLCGCKVEKYRQQYLMSFLATWFILGSLMALWLSSAGPCFVNLLDQNNVAYISLLERLREQMEALDKVPFYQGNVIDVQNYLWSIYVSNSTEFGAGISAMPSMHVSSSVLMALGAYQVDRRIGLLFWGYALIIQIASVHLGWHYAIDGYVSFFATLAIWWFVKGILRFNVTERT
ncbi:phosphatase PAP2 family protein [Vibrio sp. PNB23_22_7]